MFLIKGTERTTPGAPIIAWLYVDRNIRPGILDLESEFQLIHQIMKFQNN